MCRAPVSLPASRLAALQVADYVASMGFSVDGRKRIEIGDSPPNARVLELKTADDSDVKICRVVIVMGDSHYNMLLESQDPTELAQVHFLSNRLELAPAGIVWTSRAEPHLVPIVHCSLHTSPA